MQEGETPQSLETRVLWKKVSVCCIAKHQLICLSIY